jgi:hypothetical protein
MDIESSWHFWVFDAMADYNSCTSVFEPIRASQIENFESDLPNERGVRKSTRDRVLEDNALKPLYARPWINIA